MFVVDGKIRALPAFSRRDTQSNYTNTMAVLGGGVFGTFGGAMDCSDAKTGKLLWRMLARGWANDRQLIVADGLVFGYASAPGTSGAPTDLVLSEASTKRPRELGRFTLPIKLSQQQMTIANGRLYIRGETWVICYDVVNCK